MGKALRKMEEGKKQTSPSLTYLEILVDSVLEIIDREGMDTVSKIEVNDNVYRELSFSPSSLRQTIGYPVILTVGMSQPYRIVRKKRSRRGIVCETI